MQKCTSRLLWAALELSQCRSETRKIQYKGTLVGLFGRHLNLAGIAQMHAKLDAKVNLCGSWAAPELRKHRSDSDKR